MLTPEDFGLVALASVYIAFLSIFVEQGFGDAIVQYPQIDREDLDTAFWTSLAFSVALSAGTILFASPIAHLFHEPALVGVIRWLSLSFISIALSSTQQAILRRELRFKELAIRTMLASLLGGIAGIIMAVAGYGVWSLVGQTLITSAAGVFVLWTVSDWRPGFRYSLPHFKGLFDFGSKMIVTNIANFFNRRLDDLLIGLFLGPTALGYYTIAYRLIQVLTQVFTSATTAVAFPAFSRIQHDDARLRRAFMQAISLTSMFAFPTFIGVSVLAPQIVLFIYGPQWENSIPVMRILPYIGIIHVTLYFHSALLLAKGKPDWRMLLALVHTAANVLFFAVSVRWGIVAVATAYVLQGYLLFPVDIWVTQKTLPFSLGKYLSRLAAPAISAVIMGFAITLMQQVRLISPSVLFTGQHLLIQLIVLGLTGAIIYGICIVIFDRKALSDIQLLARSTVK